MWRHHGDQQKCPYKDSYKLSKLLPISVPSEQEASSLLLGSNISNSQIENMIFQGNALIRNTQGALSCKLTVKLQKYMQPIKLPWRGRDSDKEGNTLVPRWGRNDLWLGGVTAAAGVNLKVMFSFSPWCISKSIRSSSRAWREGSVHPAALSCNQTSLTSGLWIPTEICCFLSRLKYSDRDCSCISRVSVSELDMYINRRKSWGVVDSVQHIAPTEA